jgi:hypothetical protein
MLLKRQGFVADKRNGNIFSPPENIEQRHVARCFLFFKYAKFSTSETAKLAEEFR